MQILLLLTILGCAFSYNLHEQRLDEDELVEYFGSHIKDTGKVPEYEIVHIEHLISVKTFRHVTRDTIMEDSAMFKFRAFDEDVHVEVIKEKESFTDQTTTCVYLDATGMETEEVIPTGCFYRGNVQGELKSDVSISTCAGITGTISRAGQSDLYVEPLRESHAVKRGLESNLGHVIYKAPTEESWECGVKDGEHVNFEANGDHLDTVAEERAISQKYLKLHIVADHQYWAANGDKSCSCLTASFHALAIRMGMLPGLNLLLSRITIIKSSTTLNTGSSSNDNLDLIRTWVDNHAEKDNWDHVALMIPFYMDVGGRAWLCGVCKYNKVSVSYLGAMYGVQIVAHEMGHNLCINHDTGGFGCGRQTYVMGAAGWSEHEMGWSRCSINEYNGHVNSHSCLTDS